MKYTDLQKGDYVPASTVRGIVGSALIRRNGVPVCRWHPLRVVPGQEKASIGRLARDGVWAFCPMDQTSRVRNGKVILGEKPMITQIIYARFNHEPRWDVLKDRRIITGVFCIGSTPIDLPKDVIRVLRGLMTRSERIKAAKQELLRLTVGDRVKIQDGPFSGFFADVTANYDGRVWWQTTISNGLPVKGESDRDGVLKLDLAL